MFTGTVFLISRTHTEFLVIFLPRWELIYSMIVSRIKKYLYMRYGDEYVFVGNYRILTYFHESRTKDHRARSPFFELQAKYVSLELATSRLSRRT